MIYLFDGHTTIFLCVKKMVCVGWWLLECGRYGVEFGTRKYPSCAAFQARIEFAA